MRILFKTSYLDDIRLFQHSGQVFWYSVLVACLLLAPLVLGDFYVGELSYVFILAIAGVGLMLLIGFTGLVSLGHGAFMAIGAYTNTYLITKGVPFLIAFPTPGSPRCWPASSLPCRPTAWRASTLPSPRLAFSQIVEQIIIRWESVTRGFQGMPVPSPEIFGHALARPWEFYYFCLGVLVLVVFAAVNLTRSPTGRAMVAIRDSEISAQSLGVNLVQYKTIAFALSAGITGLAGALLAHKMRFISPDAFNILLSIQLLLMVVVGGLGSITGAILGAVFVGGLPQAIALMRDYLPTAIARTPGLEPGLFGLVMVADRAVRAARHLWALAQDQGLLRLLPAVPARHLQAAAVLPQDGARAVTLTQTRNERGTRRRPRDAPRSQPAAPGPVPGRRHLHLVRRHQGRRRRHLRCGARRDLRHRRPQRRGQEHHLQPHQPHLRADRRPPDVPGRGHHQRRRRTPSRAAASPAPSRTSSCSSTRPCSTTC